MLLFVTVKEFGFRLPGQPSAYAEADRPVNQKTAPFSTCGWAIRYFRIRRLRWVDWQFPAEAEEGGYCDSSIH
jgi:hypothetical protein